MYLRRQHLGQLVWPQSGEASWKISVEQWLAAINEELRTQTLAKQLRKRASRQSLLPKLSCIEHRHKPALYQCDQCGADLVKIGEGVSERLDVEPAGFFVHGYILRKYACLPCEMGDGSTDPG